MKTPFQQLVVTAGISFFAPFNLGGKLAREKRYLRFEQSNPLPHEMSEDEALGRWQRDVAGMALSPFTESPKTGSAEFSLMNVLHGQRRLAPRPRVALIHSATFGGRAAACALERLLPHSFHAEVVRREVPNLDVNDDKGLRRSLAEFMKIVASELETGEPRTTCFAPIGGYKVMTSLGYLAGSYLGYPTAYLHEDNQALHEIPAVPIQLSAQTLSEAAPLMKRVGGCATWRELTLEEQRFVSERTFLFAVDDDFVGVTPFGLFLMQRPEHQRVFGTRLLIEKRVAQELLRREDFCRKALQRLRELDCKLQDYTAHEGELRHDRDYQSLKDASFWLYKGGGGKFYASYCFDRATACLRVNGVWEQHDQYQQAAEQGALFHKDPEQLQYEDWSEKLHA